MADDKTAKDGSGSTFTMAFKDIASVFFKKVILYDDTGAAVDPIAPGTVAARSADVLSVMPPVIHSRAIISAASSGDNTLLAAQGASNSICVTSLFLIAASAVNVRFESGAGGTALTGVMSLAANSGFVLPYNPDGWFETGDNALLNLELGGAVQVSGAFTYLVR
jgi:hypothetical protein